MTGIVKIFRDKRISYYCLLLLFFLFPIKREIFIIALWPWVLSTIVERIILPKPRRDIISKDNVPAMLLLLLFLSMLFSLLWSNDIKEGFQNIGRLMILVIAPIVFALNPGQLSDSRDLSTLYKAYVFGVLTSTIILWILFLVKYLLKLTGSSGDTMELFGGNSKGS